MDVSAVKYNKQPNAPFAQKINVQETSDVFLSLLDNLRVSGSTQERSSHNVLSHMTEQTNTKTAFKDVGQKTATKTSVEKKADKTDAKTESRPQKNTKTQTDGQKIPAQNDGVAKNTASEEPEKEDKSAFSDNAGTIKADEARNTVTDKTETDETDEETKALTAVLASVTVPVATPVTEIQAQPVIAEGESVEARTEQAGAENETVFPLSDTDVNANEPVVPVARTEAPEKTAETDKASATPSLSAKETDFSALTEQGEEKTVAAEMPQTQAPSGFTPANEANAAVGRDVSETHGATATAQADNLAQALPANTKLKIEMTEVHNDIDAPEAEAPAFSFDKAEKVSERPAAVLQSRSSATENNVAAFSGETVQDASPAVETLAKSVRTTREAPVEETVTAAVKQSAVPTFPERVANMTSVTAAVKQSAVPTETLEAVLPEENVPERNADNNQNSRNGSFQTAQLQNNVTVATNGTTPVQSQDFASAVKSGAAEGVSGVSASSSASAADTSAFAVRNDVLKGKATTGNAAAKPNIPTNELVDQIKVRISKAAKEGVEKININLKPKELGNIQVKLETDGRGNIKASIIASRPETLDMLQKDASVLKQALAEAGLKTDDNAFNFSYRGEQQQQDASSFAQNGRRGGDHQAQAFNAPETANGEADDLTEAVIASGWTSRHALNIRV